MTEPHRDPDDPLAGLDDDQVREVARLLTDEPATAGGASELVAFFVPDGAAVPDAAALRAHAAALLPPAQIPTRFVPVTEIPRTANGKLDRRALASRLAEASPDATGPTGTTPLADDLERWIAALWSSALELPVAGGQTDFFALGGSSLAALRVLARLAAVLGIEIPLMSLFLHSTVAGFAAELRTLAADLPNFEEIVAVAAEVYADEQLSAGQRAAR